MIRNKLNLKKKLLENCDFIGLAFGYTKKQNSYSNIEKLNNQMQFYKRN
jgi:hypothetical protein